MYYYLFTIYLLSIYYLLLLLTASRRILFLHTMFMLFLGLAMLTSLGQRYIHLHVFLPITLYLNIFFISMSPGVGV
jgi:hypothetical protein